MAEQSYPRCLYRGPADDTAETCLVADAEADAVAQTDGWRPRRRVDPDAPIDAADEDDDDDEAADPPEPAAIPKRTRTRTR